MRESLKERNLKILTLYYSKSSLSTALKKEKVIEIAEELKLTIPTITRVIDKYYDDFIEKGIKNTQFEDLTEFKENLKFDNLTELQKKFLVGKLFGLSDVKALKKAGYKSRGSLKNLNANENIQDFINHARTKVLKKTKYTFLYNFELLGKIAAEGIEAYEEKEVQEKHTEKNGQEFSKRITKKKSLTASVMATATQNKMAGYNFEDYLKSEKLKLEKEKIAVEKHKAGLGDKKDLKKLEDFEDF